MLNLIADNVYDVKRDDGHNESVPPEVTVNQEPTNDCLSRIENSLPRKLSNSASGGST